MWHFWIFEQILQIALPLSDTHTHKSPFKLSYMYNMPQEFACVQTLDLIVKIETHKLMNTF